MGLRKRDADCHTESQVHRSPGCFSQFDASLLQNSPRNDATRPLPHVVWVHKQTWWRCTVCTEQAARQRERARRVRIELFLVCLLPRAQALRYSVMTERPIHLRLAHVQYCSYASIFILSQFDNLNLY